MTEPSYDQVPRAFIGQSSWCERVSRSESLTEETEGKVSITDAVINIFFFNPRYSHCSNVCFL